MNRIEKYIFSDGPILTEGAIVERLKCEYGLQMDPHLNHAPLIYTESEILSAVYRQYLDIGQKADLPIMLMTPTRRVNSENLAKSKYRDRNLLADGIDCLSEIRQTYHEYAGKIFIGGLMGCRGNAYRSDGGMTVDDSIVFHRQQVMQFPTDRTDFLFAGIMPEIDETVGMALAMAETGIPYIISFMMKRNGCLIDGTLLRDAIRKIDEAVEPKPIGYMANCIHPENLLAALQVNLKNGSRELKRFIGIQANASALSPEELDESECIFEADTEDLVDQLMRLHEAFPMRIIGGCCGTDSGFIRLLAERIKKVL